MPQKVESDGKISCEKQLFFVPVGDNNSEYEVTGKIFCSCGNDKFEVWESNKRHIIKLICGHCGKEILLFDAGKHGWNGFVCNEEAYIDRTMPFKKYSCSKCDKDVYSIIVNISSQGKEDFMEECTSTEEDWAVLETM